MFLHPYLLAGLVACCVPVALHLLMRQKPRRLVFPAFRFLVQRNKTNQRRMRLQNLLLMLLRVAVLAALVLALARPRLSAGTSATSTAGRAVVAVLLFDTSPSMEYTMAGVSRLDESRSRAGELLDGMAPDSRIAVLDSGDLADEPFTSVAEARHRIARLVVRPGAGSLNRAVERGLDLLAGQKAQQERDAPPLLLNVFTDATRAAWDARGTVPRVPEGISALVLNVGVAQPRDLGIVGVEVVPPVVAPRGRYVVRVRLRGTPTRHDTEVSCRLEGGLPDRKPVEIPQGQDTAMIEFDRVAPDTAVPLDVPLALTVALAGSDPMPFNNERHATILVRGARRMLALAEDRRDAEVWDDAQQVIGAFRNEIKTFAEADKFDQSKLATYAVIALCHASRVPPGWGKRLETYVRDGGGLALLPGADASGVELEAVQPAPLTSLRTTAPLYLAPFGAAHPITARLSSLERDADFGRDELRPFVRRYWQVGKLAQDAGEIVSYAGPGRPPALLERRVGKGRVLMFTTPLDSRFLDGMRINRWNNWISDSSFGFVLMDLAARWLGGESEPPVLAFACGQEPVVRVPSPLAPPYVVDGPGLGGAERALQTPPASGETTVLQAKAAGNYTIRDSAGRAVAGFSLDVPGGEGILDRTPVKEWEAVFGPNSVLEAGGTTSLNDAMLMANPPPREILPYLMMALLAVMALEGLLANRYYRSAPESAPEARLE